MGLMVQYNGQLVKFGGTITDTQLLFKEGYKNLEIGTAYNLVINNSDTIECFDEDVLNSISEHNNFAFVYRGILTEEIANEIYTVEYLEDLKEEYLGFFVVDFETILVTSELSIDTEVHTVRSDFDSHEIVNLMVNSEPNTKLLENIRKSNTQRNDDELLRYEIKDEDNVLVLTVKEYINSNEIYVGDIYEKLDQGDGWNLIYGLRKRNAMTWDYFEKWMYVLGTTIDLAIVKK